eukprot:11689116-Alexandrium_andersonii.AAC.1
MAHPGPGQAGGAASWLDAVPGCRLLVRYPRDRHWHERVLLWPVGGRRWVILTPDGDINDEVYGADGNRAEFLDENGEPRPGLLTSREKTY